MVAPKVGAKKTSKHESNHPPYAQMIKEAITELNSKKGSSRVAILKYINEHYDINHHIGDNSTNQHLNKALKHGIDTGELKHASTHANGASGSFKLGNKSADDKKKATVKSKTDSKKVENGHTAGSTPKKSKKTIDANKSPAAAPKKAQTGHTGSAGNTPKQPKKPQASKSTTAAQKPAIKTKAIAKKSAMKKGKAAVKK